MRKMLLAGGLAVAAIAVVATTASTNSNTLTGAGGDVAGYGAVDVSGTTAESIKYDFNNDRSQITAAHLVLEGLFDNKIVEAGFRTDPAPSGANATLCTPGAIIADPDGAGPGVATTAFDCPGLNFVTADADHFYVAVRATDSNPTT
jgi:hypothetical protein